MGGHPLRPPSRRRLGEPSPHQLADSPQAAPCTVAFRKRPPFPIRSCAQIDHAVLARVSPGCPPHRVTSLTCYSPVRRSGPRRALPRLACVKHAASVRPEPGSNSPIESSLWLFPTAAVPKARQRRNHKKLFRSTLPHDLNRSRVHRVRLAQPSLTSIVNQRRSKFHGRQIIRGSR